MPDKVAGYLEVGTNERGEVVINLDRDRVGHVVFSPKQARHLAGLLLAKAREIDRGSLTTAADIQDGSSMQILNEDCISLSDAASWLPGKPSLSTILRWSQRGYHGVRLEAFRRAGKMYTSREALERFFAKINAPSPVEAKPLQRRQREQEAAEAEAEAEGL